MSTETTIAAILPEPADNGLPEYGDKDKQADDQKATSVDRIIFNLGCIF